MLSVDALRDYLKQPIKTWDGKTICYTSGVDELLDAIEREVADMVPLPVDADGVPIHIGDVMEFTYDPPQDQPIFEVSGFGANGTLFYAPRGEVAPRKTTNASVVRHHHAPTVEDVLYESLRHFGAVEERTPEVDEWLHEQAAKLRLAGEE